MADPRDLSILLLTDNLKVGGVQRVVVDLSAGLSSEGARVGVAAENTGVLWDELSDSVHRHHAPSRGGVFGGLRYIAWIRSVLRKHKYSIVHAHQRGAALAARIAVAGTSVRVVEHVHNTFLPVSKAITSFRGHVLVACGPSIADMLVEDYKRPQKKVRTVLNAVSDLTRGQSLELPISSVGGPPRVFGIGRMSLQKNPERFVRVVKELEDHGVQISARWLGDGELLAASIQLADDLGVHSLTFAGHSPHVDEELNEADLLLMTSSWEGLPLAAIEVLSFGRGAILPDVGSCSALVNSSNGVVYDVDATAAELAEIVKANLHGEVLTTWGRNSRKLYEQRFTPKRMLAEMNAIYKEQLSVGKLK